MSRTQALASLTVSVLALLIGAKAARYDATIEVLTSPVQHGEGCFWDDRSRKVYFVDIAGELVNRYDPETNLVSRIHFEGGGVSLVVPVAESLQEFVVSRGLDLLLVEWDGVSDEPTSVCTITSVQPDKPGNRFNDGKADIRGRMWAGTMGPEPVVGQVVPYQGALFRIGTNSDVADVMLSNVSVSNGLIWTRDNKIMYYIDSPTKHVDAFDFNVEEATISNRRTVFDFSKYNIEGVPDGMTIDSDDNLWVAVFNGGQVLHINPRTEELLGSVQLPASRVTDVVFGGPHLDTLYVTTSRFGLSVSELEHQPLAGSLFAIIGLNVRGVKGHTAVRSRLVK